jgi:hypothetical protein
MRAGAEVVVEVNGEEVYRGPSKSFVANIAKLLLGAFGATGGYDLADTGIKASGSVTAKDGSTQTVWEEWYASDYSYGGGVQMALNAPDNDDTYGIVVGSGSTPVSPTDYKLASQISHGTGTGQLDYEPQTTTSSYSDTSSYLEIARSFVNKSGGDVTVREVGLIARNYWKDAGGVRNDVKFLVARDVLPTPVTVKPLGSLTVRYRITLSL